MIKKTTVLSQPPQRRRFTAEQKSSILAENAAGETVASLARIHEISESLIYSWRREAKKSSAFIRIVGTPPVSAAFSSPSNLPLFRICLPSGIVIEFASVISVDDMGALCSKLGGRS